MAIAAAIGRPPISGTTTAAAVERPMIQPRYDSGSGVETTSRCAMPVAASAATAANRQSRPAFAVLNAWVAEAPTGAYSKSTRITRVPTRPTSAATAAVASPPVHSRVASRTGRRSVERYSTGRESAVGWVGSDRRTVSSSAVE